MRLAWLLLLQVAITWAAIFHHGERQIMSDACAVSCTGVSAEVKYDIGRSYVFDVMSRTILKIAQERDTDVLQVAQAHISVHSPCEFSLKLTRTSLRGMDVEQEWSGILERFPLRFAFDDGKVEAVCPHDGDPAWAVNIKRAVLSAFQTVHDGARETDIAGDCPIAIEKRKLATVLNLKTTKQLSACHREHDFGGVRAVPYRLQSKTQALPIMETKQTCDRQITNYNLQRVTCTENYRVTSPFGEGDLGVLQVEQTLSAAGVATAEQQQPFKNRSSIVFDHSDDDLSKKGSPQHAREIIDELCRPDDRVTPDAASHFADLVYNLRGLSDQEVSSILNPRCAAFADALAACATHSCLVQLGNLINSGAAPESVYSSLSLLSSPETGIMDSVAVFIERVPLHGLLPVTSLVQSYCIVHPMCGKEVPVQRIVHSILSKIPPGCQIGEQFEEVKKAVIILKSIGNIAHEEHSLSAILGCIANDRISKAVRLAAIDALRRKPCSHQRNHKITELFRTQKENVEIRIASFRQLMECPSDEILQIVVDELHNETVNQVGSYVWSYLNTKQRSTNPGSYDLQHILKRFHMSQRYNMDPRRFSRYYEIGYFDKENNYGSHMDSSVVFVPNGYIPREVAFNFTVHLFGKSINVLEIGARAEGLEQAEEELFGADGYITNPNGHVFREKKFQSRYPKVNELKHLYGRKDDFVENRVTATFYARMFGDDLHYFGLQKDHFLDEVKQSIELDKVLAKLAHEKTMKFSRHMLLFELSQTIPTLSGLSLQFLVNATMVAKMDGKVKMNLVELLQLRGNADGHVDVRPSISIARGGIVLLRAGHVASGALVTSSLHAATSLVRSMEMRERRKFWLKFDVPHEDILFAKIRNDATKIESNRHQPFINIRRRHARQSREKHYCSGDTMAKILGIRACFNAHADLPELEATVKVEKVDPGLSSYQLVVERASGSGEQKLLISLDTPGSQQNRKMEADFELSIPRKKLKLGVITPFKRILLDGNLQEIRHLHNYATNLKLVVDDKEYSLDGTLEALKAGHRNSYKLNAKSVAGSTAAAEVAAEMQYSITKPYAMIDFHLDKVFREPIIFRTLLNPEAPNYEAKLEYTGPNFNGNLGSSVVHQGLIDLKGTINAEYQVGNKPRQVFEVGLDQAFQKRGTNHHFKHAVRAFGTSFPRLDFQVLSDRTGNNMKNLLEANYFGKKAFANFDVTRGPNDMYTAVGSVKCDQLGVDTKTNIVYQNLFPQQFTLKIDAETPRIRDLHASAEYDVKVDPKWCLTGNVRLAYPGREITLSKKIDELSSTRHKMETHLQWNPRGRVDAISNIIFNPFDHEYAIESVVNVAGVREPVSIKKHVKYQHDNINIQWQAHRGKRTIYELNGDLQGQFGAPQRLNVNIKSDEFEPKFNYHVTADIQPSADTVTAHATIHEYGRDLGKGDITFPKKFNLPNQQYRGEFHWNDQNRPHKAVAEYNRQEDPRGSTYAVNVQSDDNINLNMQLDHHDRMHFKCDLDKDLVRTVSAELTATPFRWDFFEVNGHLDTDRPLERRSIKTKTGFNYRTNQANAEGFFEINGERYVVDGQWRKELQGAGRHYIYAGKLETPQSRIHLDQQFLVENAFTLRKTKTVLELAGAGKTYSLKNEMNSDDNSFNTITDLAGSDIGLKHILDYNHKYGERILKKHLKYNQKEINVDATTIYRDGEMKVDVGVSSTFETPLRNGKAAFSCRKGPVFWNCDTEGNINMKYLVKGHEALSPQRTDIGYLIKLGNLVNNEGEISFDVDNRASKYNANAMLRNAEKKYDFKMDVTGNQGFVKLHTPTYAIDNAQVRVMRRGPTEFELQSEGGSQGKIHAHIKTGDHDKLFKIQITEIPEPFQLHLENSAGRGMQKSVAELTMDPLGQKRIYGLENEIEGEGDTFRAMRSTIKHPKRKMHIEILRPARNKYSVSVQPHVGGSRRPTVAEMTYDKTAYGYHWEGTISDQALQRPLKAKVDYKKNERDRHNYGLDLHTEFDYSGQPEKLFSNSFHLHRSIISPGRGKRNMVTRGHGDVRFIAELKSTHPASNLNTHLWAKVDRRRVGEAVIPVHATFGLETQNTQHQQVEYSIEAKTDAAKFTEAQLKSPGLLMKARIDKINDNHYTFGLYKNNERPSFVGDLTFRSHGPELEFRDERSREVKLHASAQMPNDYEGKVDLWHSEGRRKIQDARLTLQMEENNLLKGNVYIRPAIESDVVKTAKETASGTGKLRHSSFMSDALLPIFSSHKQIANDVMNTLDRTIKEWTSEQRNFAAELGSEYTKLVNEVEENYGLIREMVLVTYDQIYQAVEQFVNEIPRSDFASQLQQLRSGGDDLRREILAALKPISDLIDKFYKELEKLQRNAATSFGRLEDVVKLKDLRRALEEMKNKFEQADVIQTVLYEARKLSREYQLPEVERTIAGIEVNRRRYETKALEIYNKIKDLLLDKVVVSTLTKVTSALLSPLDENEVREKWQEVVNYLRGKITAEEMSRRFWRKYIPEVKRLNAGEYAVEVTVPHEVTSLKDLLSDLHPQHFLALKSALVETVGLSPEDKIFAESLLDTIYTYRPTKFDPWKMLQPFESIAYIIDGDRFISFDGRVFAFHARCEYLLASDFIHQRFALFAIFSAYGHLEAIKAELRNEEVILHKNGNVQVNGVPISMPWQKVDRMDGAAVVSIHRRDQWIVLKTYDGVKVRCNFQRDICEIVLPGRMHGRSNGLLGPNDNEPSNDRNLIDGTHNEQLNVLAEHWAVTGSCRVNEARDLSHRDDDQCHAYFHSSSSPLRFCFAQVRSKPFEEICSNGGKQEHCTAASAYLEVCSNAGITMALPHECVECDNGLNLDDERKIEKPPTEHDVVFVVEERKCMESHKNKLLRVAQRISQEQQRSVLFGWVGFGGEGVHYEPHVHYEGNEAGFDISSFSKQIQQTFEPVSGIEPPHGCAKGAVEFATKHFPFRYASAKSIVLVMCRKCTSQGQAKMLDTLLDQDITMHLLTLSKFKANGGLKVVGMDAQQLFDERGAQIGQRASLRIPNDACSIVAQQSFGSVFSLKHGFMIAASKVVPKPGSYCLNCQCTADGLVARNVCRPCETTQPAKLASYGAVDSGADTDSHLLDTLF